MPTPPKRLRRPGWVFYHLDYEGELYIYQNSLCTAIISRRKKMLTPHPIIFENAATAA